MVDPLLSAPIGSFPDLGPIPRVVVDGFQIAAMEPSISPSTLDEGAVTVQFLIEDDGPKSVYRIGATVQLAYGNRVASMFRVVGLELHEESTDSYSLYKVSLQEIGPIIDSTSDLDILYGSVFETVMNRLRTRALLEVLIDKGILGEAECNEKLQRVIEERLVDYATSIVSREDAESMREAALTRIEPQSESL